MNTQEKAKAIRAKSKLSQVKFAERYGIPRRTVENWESGDTITPEYVLELLNRAVSEDFKE